MFFAGRAVPIHLFCLALGGACLAMTIANHAGSLLHYRFTLTTHDGGRGGALFSVALSVRLPCPVVNWHRAL